MRVIGGDNGTVQLSEFLIMRTIRIFFSCLPFNLILRYASKFGQQTREHTKFNEADPRVHGVACKAEDRFGSAHRIYRSYLDSSATWNPNCFFDFRS